MRHETPIQSLFKRHRAFVQANSVSHLFGGDYDFSPADRTETLELEPAHKCGGRVALKHRGRTWCRRCGADV